MKTQILQLERYDDIISARDKMGWGQTQRIVLVWPSRGRILHRKLDLLLLLRHSRQMGSQIALVSWDPDVLFYADELGIPVFESIESAQNERWRRSRGSRLPFLPSRTIKDPNGNNTNPRERLEQLRQQARPERPGWSKNPNIRLAVFAIAVLAVLLLAAILVPSATITLEPEVRIQEAVFSVRADETLEAMNTSGVVPARPISVVVEGRETIQTSGRTTIPNTPARGSVRFTNLTDDSVNIPAGTVVLAGGDEPIRFATTRAGRLGPGTNQTTSLPIEAITRGSVGNLPAGRVDSLEGGLGLQISVTNPQPTHGGSDYEAPAPSQADRRRLQRSLLRALKITAQSEVQSRLSDGDISLSPEPSVLEILEENYTPTATQASENLELLMRVEFVSLVVSENDLQGLATLILDNNLPDGYAVVDNPVDLQPLTAPLTLVDGEAGWEMRALRTIVPELREVQAINLAMGLSPEEAVDGLIESLDLNTVPLIQLRPSWWPRLPFLPFRIQVVQEG